MCRQWATDVPRRVVVMTLPTFFGRLTTVHGFYGGIMKEHVEILHGGEQAPHGLAEINLMMLTIVSTDLGLTLARQ